ncbi:MAG: hypothetical protein R3F59_16105 [Myxococcota bacterium]
MTRLVGAHQQVADGEDGLAVGRRGGGGDLEQPAVGAQAVLDGDLDAEHRDEARQLHGALDEAERPLVARDADDGLAAVAAVGHDLDLLGHQHPAEAEHGVPLLDEVAAEHPFGPHHVGVHHAAALEEVVVARPDALDDEAHPVVVELHVAGAAFGADAAEQRRLVGDDARADLTRPERRGEVEGVGARGVGSGGIVSAGDPQEQQRPHFVSEPPLYTVEDAVASRFSRRAPAARRGVDVNLLTGERGLLAGRR